MKITVVKQPGLSGANFIGKVVLAAASLLISNGAASAAATLGTVVPMPGHISEIAVDSGRSLLYAANFTANRIEVLSMATKSLQSSIPVANRPSSVAVSPDGRYLVVGHYALPASPSAAVTIIDLSSRSKLELTLGGESVLAVAFGNGSQALVVSNLGLRVLDPSTGTFTSPLPLCPSTPLACANTTPLPAPWATFPPQILKASAGVSGDGNVIYVLIDVTGGSSIVVRYDVTTGVSVLSGVTAAPPLGPRVMSVDKTGATFLAGWVLLRSDLVNLAQLPYASGSLNQGGHAFDASRKLIYAQSPVSVSGAAPAAGSPVLHVMDSDNLAVLEIFRLRENLAGKALMSGDTMYAISDSGVTILPVAALATVHRVKALQEDLLFQGNGCDQRVASQFVDIVDPSGGATDFTLSAASAGVRFSQTSGTTPARVQVVVDPTVFQDKKGTATVLMQIASTQAVNVPAPVRLLINTRDPDQQGNLYDVPGTIVDVLADPVRDRFYVLRQDTNQVLVFDGTTFDRVAVLRTGNTPVQMAISQDQLMVTNDNSQIVNVFDLSTLNASDPVVLPGGFYARSIAVSNRAILATARNSGGAPCAACVIAINLSPPTANLASTGIYTNGIDANSVLAASSSGNTIFMTMPDGTVGLYEAQADTFIASRKDLASLSGAYAALSDNLFIAGNHLFNTSLVPVGDVDLLGGVSSGAMAIGGKGVISATPLAGRSGVVQRFSMETLNSITPVRTGESAIITQNLATTPVYQIGQTILPFTRTIAPLTNRQFLVQLSTSGFTAVPWAFDTALQPPAITSITNAADQTPGVAPGGLVTIWGSGLGTGNASAGTIPLPKGMGGVCLYANSIAMPLLFVSPTQINAQLPFNMPASATLVISNAGGQSSPFNFNVQPTAPAVFRTGDGTAVIVRTVDGKLITDQTPIHLNQVLNIYMTGMGTVGSPVAPGSASPSSPLAATTVAPTITIGGASIFTLWSGLAPGLVGVYQVNAQVPFHHIPTGSNIPFTITQGGASTTIKLRVEE